jgi:Domain of unknown function (DUF1906)
LRRRLGALAGALALVLSGGGGPFSARAIRAVAEASAVLAPVRSIRFGGMVFDVPSDWPVYSLVNEPGRCVRFDVHAVYLGHQGRDASCPSRLVGKTDAVQVEPLDEGSRSHLLGTGDERPINAESAVLQPLSAVSHSVVAAFPNHQLLVTLTWSSDSAGANLVLHSFRSGASMPPRVAATVVTTPTLPLAGSPLSHAAVAADTFTGSAFDTCSAPSSSTMSAWLASSPYRSMNIYIGGANRACGDGNLSGRWVASVENSGWHLIPTYVGLQAPCVGQAGLAPIDPSQAALEGTGAADDAVARAQNFGLAPGSPVFFDMEAYGRDPSCIQAVQSFLSAWTAELHNRGFVAGVYGSSCSTIADQAAVFNDRTHNRVDDIWFARWNDTPNIYGDQCFSDTVWTNHQRLHQFQGEHTESYGGVTLSIDGDVSDGDQAPPGFATWSPWRAVAPGAGSAPPQSAPAVASWGPGRLDVFWQGADRQIYHQWSVDCACTESIGGPPGGAWSAPAAVSWSLNRLDVLVRGGDQALWHTFWDSSGWHQWARVGGLISRAPAAASWNAGRLDVFVVGLDQHLYHTYWGGQFWRPFEALGGLFVSDPAAVSWGPDRIDLFTLGSGGVLYHEWWDGVSWLGWRPELVGNWASAPTVASWGSGRLDVFLAANQPGYPLDHVYWNGAGWNADHQDGKLTGAPAAVAWGYQRVDVLGRGAGGGLYHKWWGS